MDPKYLLQRHVWIVILCLLLFSCQTFGVKKRIPTPRGTFEKRDHAKYAMKIDLLYSEQSKEYFGVDLNEMGIQAVILELKNKIH